MAISHVQTTTGHVSSLQFTNPTVPGNLAIIGVGVTGRTITLDGNPVQLIKASVGTSNLEVSIAQIISSHGVVNVSGAALDIAITEIQGPARLSTQANVNNATSANPDSGNMTTSAGDVLIYGFMTVNNANTVTAGSGFTIRGDENFDEHITCETKTGVAGTYSASFTCTSGVWICIGAIFESYVIPPTTPIYKRFAWQQRIDDLW